MKVCTFGVAHELSTSGAEAGNSIGVAGVSWKPQIMALKFLGASGLGVSKERGENP